MNSSKAICNAVVSGGGGIIWCKNTTNKVIHADLYSKSEDDVLLKQHIMHRRYLLCWHAKRLHGAEWVCFC